MLNISRVAEGNTLNQQVVEQCHVFSRSFKAVQG